MVRFLANREGLLTDNPAGILDGFDALISAESHVSVGYVAEAMYAARM